MAETEKNLIAKACANVDWLQVVCNGGPPCFHVEEDGRFCFRAKRWEGHWSSLGHTYVSLLDFYKGIC